MLDDATVSLSSNGSGGFYSALMKDGLLAHMKKAKVDFLNVINISDVALNICDPAMVGLLATKHDIIAQVSPRVADMIPTSPSILAKDSHLVYCDPYELEEYCSRDHKYTNDLEYYMYALNCYLPITLLETGLGQNFKNDLFKYKIKLRPAELADEVLLSFEINLFNILPMAKSPKLFIREMDDVASCKYSW